MAKRARTERRKNDRDVVKLARARMKLASLEAGGSAERPIEVVSASTIEGHAASMPCGACGGNVLVEEHIAVTEGERRLRVTKVVCRQCGVRRDVWFRIGSALPS